MRIESRTMGRIAIAAFVATRLTLPGDGVESATAQDGTAAKARAVSPSNEIEQNDARSRAKLAERIEANFIETPLADVLGFLSDATGVQFYANWKKIEAAGVANDAPVSLHLAKVRGSMALELALDQAGGDRLAYVVRDGVAIVSTVEDLDDAAMLRVYNCRDLLARSAARNSSGGLGMPVEGMLGYGRSGSMAGMGSMMGAMGSGGAMDPGGVMGEATPPASNAAAQRLVSIFTHSISPSSWETAGGSGTIAEFGGLIVVNHNPRVHAQVEQILKMLRQAAAVEEGAGVADEN